ncbi:MAG: cytochrome P460 family protein [Burkholderiales bacterium]|nr:cytochrome P460 family protein [Burkholderiales bacterium]
MRRTIPSPSFVAVAAAVTATLAVTLVPGGTAVGQAAVPSGPNVVAFPQDWAKGTLYATVDRPDTKQYREFYTSAEALAAARAGRPIPDGTVITLAAYAAQADAAGAPLKDANGRFLKGNLLAVNVMQKKAGWGEQIPAAIRNGDWIYQSFTPDGKANDKANLTACYQCHLPFAKDDYLTNMAKLKGTFPTQAAAAAVPGAVTIAGFQFGPATLKVTAGQKVTWVNNDDTPHQVTLVGGDERRSDLMLKGQSATMQFDAAGNIAYICGLHPGMKGTIEVAARP